MNRINHYTIPLNKLLAVLNSNGYALTIEQILEVQQILLSSPISKLPTGELKYIITPVIAKNEEEQHDIYAIIDNWVAEKTSITEPVPKRFQKWLKRHMPLVLALKLTGLLLAIGVAIFLYIVTTREHRLQDKQVKQGKLNADTVNRQLVDSMLKNVPTPGQATLPQFPKSNTQKGVQPTHPVPDISLGYVSDWQHPIPPAKMDNRLPISLVFGFLMGAILFHAISYEKRKRMELEKRKRAEDGIFTIPEKDDGRSAMYPYNEAEQLQQLNLQFFNRDYLIHRPGLLQKVKNVLQRPAYVENPAINIKATIAKSVHSAGLATIVTESEWKDRKYILLCERKDHEAHITSLLDYAVKHIRADNPNITRYNYTDDIMALQDLNGRPIALEQLVYLFPHHHIIIIGNCHSFFEPGNPSLREDIRSQFAQLNSRSIITPVPIPDWSNAESQLQDHGFHIVPAEMEAIDLLARAITEHDEIKKELLLHRLKDTYSVSKFDFRYADELKAYLNNEQLFQAVCALAVYPFLQWPITLSLFAAFEKNWPGFAVSYDNLLKVARIPWLHGKQLDQSIRLQLLDALDAKTETIARETIIKLLDEMKPHTSRDSQAFTELKVQYNINAFFLYSHDQLKYKQYAGVKEVIGYYWNNLEEWELKEHIKRKHSGLIPGSQVKATATVEGFVVREKQYEKLNIRLTKLSVLTLPAALLFILFTIFKPGIVYMEDSGQKVSLAIIIKKDTNCQQNLVRASIDNNFELASKALDRRNNSDTIHLSDIRYNSYLQLKLYTGNGSTFTMSVPATYAICNITTRCKEMKN